MIELFQRVSDRVLPAGSRIALAVEYNGSAYRGWQSQAKPAVASVQDRLEAALSSIAAAPLRVNCAGRTDAGVHASYQVVHFDSPSPRSAKAWVCGANAMLPSDISVLWAQQVDPDFHARFSATARRYRYILLNQPQRSAHFAGRATLFDQPLDAELMHREAQCLLGEQDFTAFRAAACQSRSPMRNVHFVAVQRRDRLLVIDIAANAFLHHMVRNIVGALCAVGSAQQPPGWTEQLLLGRDRSLGAATAKPDGLYLVDVSYPERFGLPPARRETDFIAGL